MKHFIFVISSLFILSSCSRSDIMFSFADNIIVSKTDDFFDLNRQQKKELHQHLDTDLARIRKESLPTIVKSLREIEAHTRQEKIEAPWVAQKFEEFQTQSKSLTLEFQKTAVQLSLSLQPEQFNHLEKEMREEIHKTEKENRDSSDSDRKNFKRYQNGLEMWFGGLSKDQKEKVKNFSTTHPFPWKLQNANREFVLTQFLESKKDPEKIKAFVSLFFQDYEAVRLPAYKEAVDANKMAFRTFLIETFWPSLNETQKKNLSKNLLASADELEKLSQRP